MSLPALAPDPDACPYCARPVAEPDAVRGPAGTVLHAGCAAAAEIERLMRRAANAIAQAEVTIRGVPLP